MYGQEVVLHKIKLSAFEHKTYPICECGLRFVPINGSNKCRKCTVIFHKDIQNNIRKTNKAESFRKTVFKKCPSCNNIRYIVGKNTLCLRCRT